MKKFSFALLIGFIYLGTSCQRTDYSKEIAQVDSLSAVVERYLFQVDSLDSMQIEEYFVFLKEDTKWIQDSLAKEYMKDASIFLLKVRTADKLSKSFPQIYVKLKRELKYSQSQLADLKKDLSNASIEPEKAKGYLATESMAADNLGQQHSKFMKRLTILKDYEVSRNDFYDRIDELNE